MLTIASILPLAPLYLEMEGLKTSSNSRLTAMNCHRCPDLGTHHGQGSHRVKRACRLLEKERQYNMWW